MGIGGARQGPVLKYLCKYYYFFFMRADFNFQSYRNNKNNLHGLR
jgi:hypothetical protein